MRTGVVTLAIVVAGLGAAALAQEEPQSKPRELRVMTYNIKHGMSNAACAQPAPAPVPPGEPRIPYPDCGLDLEGAAAVVRAYDPDIIGLQEIDRFWARSAYLDEPAALAAALGRKHHCYGANLNHNPDSHANVPHQYGTVIISRYPILECSNTFLPRTGTNEQRGLTKAVIDVQGVPLQFYNTHLHTTQPDRLLQTAFIAAVLDAAPDGPTIVTGDFNARPTAPEMMPMYARLLDSWVEAPFPKLENPNGFTSPARLTGNPTSRIDYVFVSPDVKVAATHVPIDPETRLAADHYPVVSEMAVPGSALGTGDQEGDRR